MRNTLERAQADGSCLSNATLSCALLSVAVFVLSFAVLVFEVALTRLFSVVLRYHFVFLVTSVAVCGLGTGGLVLHQLRAVQEGLRGSRSDDSLPLFLVFQLLGFSVTVPAVIVFTLLWLLPRYPTCYAGVAALILIPFVFAGIFLAEVFRRFARQSGKLYGADLAGAAIAAGAVVLLLKWAGAIDTCFIAAAFCAACAITLLCLSKPDGRRTRNSSVIMFAGLLLIGNAALVTINQKTKFVDIRPLRLTRPDQAMEMETISKPLFRELADPRIGARIVRTDWSAFARTDVVEETDAPTTKYIWTDGEVPTQMEKFDGDLKKMAYLKGFIGFLPYNTAKVNKALCIGPGGGLDILLALLAGVPQIDGVEINPSIPDIMRQYAEFNGHLYTRPNVRVSVGDGRTFVRHSRQQYDLTYLALTQTATTGSVGLALVESYIHTTDALRDYLAHLTDRGRIALITQEYSLLCRYFASAVKVCGNGRDSEGCRHVALFCVGPEQHRGNPYRNLCLIQKAPYTEDEARKLLAYARRMRLRPLFVPYVYEGVPFGHVARGNMNLNAFIAMFRNEDGINISPVTDDSPFFLDLSLSTPPVLKHLWIGALILVALFSVWVIVSRGRTPKDGTGEGVRIVPFILYFTGLGIGFMLVEVALAQKLILFLGYPTLALSVILCALLLGGGCGSWVSQGFPANRLRECAMWSAFGVVALTIFETVLIRLLFWKFSVPSIALRCVLTFVLLLPLGFCLGMPFPTGIRMLERISAAHIPWMWGVNGVTSVVGSVLAAIGAKLLGFNYVLLLSSIVYGLLGLCLIPTAVREIRMRKTDAQA